MSQDQENIYLGPQNESGDGCIHCNQRQSIQLWMPKQVLEYLSNVYGEQKTLPELQYMFLKIIQANLEDLSEYSPKASALARGITRIIADINEN